MDAEQNAQSPLRILGIAPYEGMRSAMVQAAEGFPDLQLDVYTGDLECGVDIVRRTQEEGYDAIISRGGTAVLIRQITDLPVVEIRLSVYDVLRTIKLAQNYSALYAIVGFPNITEPAHILCDLLRYDVDILTTDNAKQVLTTLQRLREGGYRMVVGDMVTHTIARELGFDAFLITSGAESLGAALEQAREQGKNYRRMRRQNQLMQRILQSEKDNILVLHKDGSLYYAAPVQPDAALTGALRARLGEVPHTGVLKFYHRRDSVLYHVTGQQISLEGKICYLFRFEDAIIPLRAGKAGLLAFNEAECDQMFCGSFYHLAGAMGDLEGKLPAIAATRQPVLIAGETGTGKRHIAKAIYLRSSLHNNPFVCIDCALADEKCWDFLLEHHSSPLNDTGGTLYFQHLDALSDQRRRTLLSRILETELSRRERLIFSCTCKEDACLPESCQTFSGKLGCLTLRLPSLRSRSDEISSLSSVYLSSLNQELCKQIIGFEPHAMKLLEQYSWPNNYTQFKQVLLELATFATSSYIRGSDTAELLTKERSLMGLASATGPAVPERRTLDEITLDAVRAAIAACDGNLSAAARRLGISRTTLWRLMNRIEETVETP